MIVVFGGAGFIGSHVAEFYARRGERVRIVDDRSRAQLLHTGINKLDNWNWVRKLEGVEAVEASIVDQAQLFELVSGADAIVHAAGQTAVTVSVEDPATDFRVNAVGTLNVLEAARRAAPDASVVFCSTNKVYGANVNALPHARQETRYTFTEDWRHGVPETLSIDGCEHSPYGASKATADLYVQEYGHLYGLRAIVFRMSCIYGPRQWGVTDQGWVAWFARAILESLPITVFGDGLQTRDLLHVSDLVAAIDKALNSNFRGEVFNIGGGPAFARSLIETIDYLERVVGKSAVVSHSDWRPSDQRVYVSDVRKADKKLGWIPAIAPEEGIKTLIRWLLAER